MKKKMFILGFAIVVILFVAFLIINSKNDNTIVSNEAVNEESETEAAIAEDELKTVGEAVEEEGTTIDEDANGEYTGQDVNFATDETIEELENMEIVEDTSGEDEYGENVDWVQWEIDTIDQVDSNGDGIITKNELTAAGWDTSLIRKGDTFYEYMIDPNNDGIIWEDEME